MNKINQPKNKHMKFFIVLAVPVILLATYFLYKYTYIYTERKKYDQAEVVLKKVAADLRAQGIETEFSRGCGRTQVVYGKGSINCIVGITTKLIDPESIEKTKNSLINNSFKLVGNRVIDNASISSNSSVLVQSNHNYTIIFDVSNNNFELYYSQPSRFKLF